MFGVDREDTGDVFRTRKAGDGVIESTADRLDDLFVGRFGQAEVAHRKRVTAVDGAKLVDERAVEIEENCAQRHEGTSERAAFASCESEMPQLVYQARMGPWRGSCDRGNRRAQVILPLATIARFAGREKSLEPCRWAGESEGMPDPVPNAHADAVLADGVLTVTISGTWQITAKRPVWHTVAERAMKAVPGAEMPKLIRVQGREVEAWDSSLPLFVAQAQRGAESIHARFELSGLPYGVEVLLEQMRARGTKMETPARPDLFTAVGLGTNHILAEVRELARLVGECAFSVARFVRGQAQFRWRDSFAEMQACGVMALPIVGVIALLVGVILAYQASAQLRQFGADIYVADMVGAAVVREMGPLMTAIVLAGRTGAAFAATLGSMKANEEIDAFETLGVSPVDFLVMPRITALLAMLPLLVLFANALGVMGGLIISAGILDIPASLYWSETKSFVDLSDLFTGLIKAATYGGIIGLSGCLRGMQAERSAGGVGAAATSAVVTSILLIIVANAVFAVLFNILGW